jgi:uncharacterized protein
MSSKALTPCIFACSHPPATIRSRVNEGALKVHVTAPPLEDGAHAALRRLLAGRLMVPLWAVKIVAVAHSRSKRVEISGVSPEQLRALLGGQ